MRLTPEEKDLINKANAPGRGPKKGAFRSFISSGSRAARSLGPVARAAGPATILGLGVAGGASYLRKNQSGDTDWSRAADTGLLAGEAAYAIQTSVFNKTAAASYIGAPLFGAEEKDIQGWAETATRNLEKSGGKRIGSAFTGKALKGFGLAGAISGAFLGATVFGDSQTNTTSFEGAAATGLAMGTLATLAHKRLGSAILRQARSTILGHAQAYMGKI